MRTRIIGLTGGIGSGKSTVARMFEAMGVPVYYADDEARKILYTPKVVAQLRQTFGDAAFSGNEPDRKKIAALVFSDKEKLALLNNIIHPKVATHFTEWLLSHKGASFIIREAAILFESGAYKQCDAIITVTAPVEERILRVMSRDGVQREDVEKRIANQWPEEEKIAKSNYIVNNISLNEAEIEVNKIFKILNNPEN